MAMSAVNHPSHYNVSGRKECIVEMYEKFGNVVVVLFCALNAYKYLYRGGHKEDITTDIAKAKWYINYAKAKLTQSWFTRFVVRLLFNRTYKYIQMINK